METRKEDFDKILLCAIDEEMKRILGETATEAIYFYLQKERLKCEDIPNHLEEFLFTLERIFNVGALVIEKAIMENLYRHLSRNGSPRVKLQNAEQFNCIEYVNALKKSMIRRS